MKFKIISSSIRKGRKSHHVALFINQWLQKNTDVDSEILDLKQLDFPLFEERLSFLEKPDQKIIDFANNIDSADAVFMVVPEYNGSFPASLKNVIDLLYAEWQKKPICIASVSSGDFAGTQMVKDLEFLMYKIGACVIKSRFAVGNVETNFNSNGELIGNQELFNKNILFCYNDLKKYCK